MHAHKVTITVEIYADLPDLLDAPILENLEIAVDDFLHKSGITRTAHSTADWIESQAVTPLQFVADHHDQFDPTK